MEPKAKIPELQLFFSYVSIQLIWDVMVYLTVGIVLILFGVPVSPGALIVACWIGIVLNDINYKSSTDDAERYLMVVKMWSLGILSFLVYLLSVIGA